MSEPRSRRRAGAFLRRVAAIGCLTLATTLSMSVAAGGVAHAALNKDEKSVISILAWAYNKTIADGKRTLDTDRKFDTRLRDAAEDWNESYVEIRELFDSLTGGVGEFRGNFESANITDGSATRVTGWACLPKHPFSHLNIEVYESGTAPGRLLGSVVANQPREAAVGDQCSGTTDHGFNGTVAGVCTTPGAIVPLRIDAYAVDPQFPNVRQNFPPKSGVVRCP